jgi:hypothetical protein
VKADRRQTTETADNDGQGEENTGFRMQPAAAELQQGRREHLPILGERCRCARKHEFRA